MNNTMIYGSIWLLLSIFFVSDMTLMLINLNEMESIDNSCYLNRYLFSINLTSDIKSLISGYTEHMICFNYDSTTGYMVERVNEKYSDVFVVLSLLIITNGLFLYHIIQKFNYKIIVKSQSKQTESKD